MVIRCTSDTEEENFTKVKITLKGKITDEETGVPIVGTTIITNPATSKVTTSDTGYQNYSESPFVADGLGGEISVTGNFEITPESEGN